MKKKKKKSSKAKGAASPEEARANMEQTVLKYIGEHGGNRVKVADDLKKRLIKKVGVKEEDCPPGCALFSVKGEAVLLTVALHGEKVLTAVADGFRAEIEIHNRVKAGEQYGAVATDVYGKLSDCRPLERAR